MSRWRARREAGRPPGPSTVHVRGGLAGGSEARSSSQCVLKVGALREQVCEKRAVKGDAEVLDSGDGGGVGCRGKRKMFWIV